MSAHNNFKLSLSLLSTLSLSLSAHFNSLSSQHTQQWDEEDFTNFQALLWLSMVIGQVLKTEDSLTNLISTILQFALTPLLTKVVKLSTPLIGVLSAVSKASYYVLIANTQSRTMVSSRTKTLLTSKQW